MAKNAESIRLRVMHCPRYDNEKWHRRVMNMPMRQVIAIDQNFTKSGYYNPQPEIKKPEEFHQMDVWEWITEKEEHEMYESKDEMVSHPKHYQTEGAPEVIDVIENYISDLFGIFASDTANIIKYSLRWNKKNGVQDIEKVAWYAQHLVTKIEEFQEREGTEFFREVPNYGSTVIIAIAEAYMKDVGDYEIKYAAENLIQSALSWMDLETAHYIFNDAIKLKELL